MLVYLNTLPNPFVFDDTAHINEDRIRPLSEWAATLTESRRGLANLTIAINWAIDRDEPRGYHLFNLVIHALAAVTLYGVVRRAAVVRLSRSAKAQAPERTAAWLAFAVALLWVVHPLNTQAVTYVIQRHESLMGLFYLLTLYGAARAAEGARLGGAIAIAAFAAGMWTKEVMVTAPMVALLLDRGFFAGSFAEALRRRWWMYAGLAAVFVGTFGLWAAWGLLQISGEGSSAGFGMPLLNWWQYLLSQGEIILHYLRLSIWPHPLVLDYQWLPAWYAAKVSTTRLVLDLILPVAAVALLLGVSVWGLVRNTWWGFAGFAFFAILSVSSSVIPIADVIFEHRMYLSLACVLTLIVVGGWLLLRTLMDARQAAAAGGALTAIVALLFAGMTLTRNFEYASAVSIWRTVTERAPHNPRGWHNLGEALGSVGQRDEAMAAYERALAIVPTFSDAHHNLGQIWMDMGRPDRALPQFQQAVRHAPKDAASRYGLATALASLGRLDEAMLQIDEALDLAPDLAKAHDLRGTIYARKGRPDDAIASFRRAIEIDPTFAAAHYNLGLTLRNLGRYAEAAEAFDQAIKLDFENPQYLATFARLLATAPDEGVRDGALAVDLAVRASVMRQNRDIVVLDTLAAAHAEAGQWEMALSVQRHAVQLAERAGLPAELIEQMRQRLALYESERPYRETFGDTSGPGSRSESATGDAETDDAAPAAP